MNVRRRAAILYSALIFAAPAAAHAKPMSAADVAQGCELHIWPTENYVGIKTGLLSAFGAIGAVADLGANKGKVATVKDLMRAYLGPAIQVDELTKADAARVLGLAGYRIVAEQPTPSNDDAKHDPTSKARAMAMNARLKSGERLSTSTAGCYAELVGTRIFYLKTMLYPGKLFSSWTFRVFPTGGGAPRTYSGSVKNSLREFPAKSEATIDAAKADIRATYAQDFAEYVRKKVASRQK